MVILNGSRKIMIENKINNINESFILKETLKAKWSNLCQRLNISDNLATFENLLNHYSEPPRAYHTLNHIHSCLQELDSVKSLLNNPEAVELAIWYHDIIYTIGQIDNEEKSAKIAVQFCQKNNLAPDFTKQVEEHILATKHSLAIDNSDSQYLADIDMSTLGKQADLFDKYEEQIHQEYLTLYSENDYQKGRIIFLETILEHRIYLTDFFNNKYEQTARNNIQRTLNKFKQRG